MYRAIAIAGLALVALTPPALADRAALSPAQIGQIFCFARLGNDMAPVSGLLTAELTAAIAAAEARNTALQAQFPDEKPPLGDGIPWQAWPDYAASCSVGAVTLMPEEASVDIDYGFPEAPDANFSDSLLLKPVLDPAYGESRWRIDNVAFGTESDLKAVLLGAFDQN